MICPVYLLIYWTFNVPIICVRWGVTPPKIINSTKTLKYAHRFKKARYPH